MKMKEIKNAIALAQDMINVFTDYSYSLDEYFKSEENKKNHLELYNEYMVLSINLKNALKKNGFDKK